MVIYKEKQDEYINAKAKEATSYWKNTETKVTFITITGNKLESTPIVNGQIVTVINGTSCDLYVDSYINEVLTRIPMSSNDGEEPVAVFG